MEQVAEFRRSAAAARAVALVREHPGAGHCFTDELPLTPGGTDIPSYR